MNLDILLSIGVTILLGSIKNPESKARVRKIALKVYTSIKTAFAGDPDFI